MKTGQEQLTFLNMLLVLFCVGIYGAAAVLPPFSGTVWTAVVLLVFAGIAVAKSSRWSWLLLGAAFLLLGAVRFLGAYELPGSDIVNFAGQEVEVCGTVLEAPVVTERQGKLRTRCLVEMESGQKDGRAVAVSGRGYVYVTQKPGNNTVKAEIGDRITVSGVVRELHGYENPGRIDTVTLMRSHGITARVFAVGGSGTVKVEKDTVFSLRRLAEKVRAMYLSLMESVMPKEDAAAIFAMLFGGYEGIKPELTEAFTVTGIVHILSVSGSHITLLVTCIAWLGRRLRLRERTTAALVLLLVAAYCLLAGGVPPAVRAGIMGMIAFIGQLNGREHDARRILTLTGLGMLIVSPLLFFDISFRLSFGSAAGLLYISPHLRERLEKLPDFIATNLAITVGAQLAVLPLIAWHFNQVSLSSLLANIVVVPIVEFIIVIALAAGLLGGAVPVLGKLIFLAASLLMGTVYELTRFIARLPFATVYIPSFPVFFDLVYYSALTVLLQDKELFGLEKRRLYQGAVVVGLPVIIVGAVVHFTKAEEMTVHFIDVGQGDAALVVTPHGKAILIDSGGTMENAYDVGGRVVAPYLLHYGVTELDTVYLTHSHADHAAGAGGVIKKLPVSSLVIGKEGREAYAKAMGLSYADDIFKRTATATEGQTREIDGVKIEMLYVPEAVSGKNEASNVIRVSYGRASFLFTGDLPAEKERALLAIADPQSTVLKVGHHGSKTSSSEEFLSAVGAKWAVISVGAGNTFGHPDREVLKRLQRRGMAVYRTDRDGAVVFRTDGREMRISGRVTEKLKAFRY